jgi:hypothetical protein
MGGSALSPVLGQSPHLTRVCRPIVEHGWVEVRAGRPHECMDFRVDIDPAKELLVLERTVDFARQHVSEVDYLSCRIVELYAQSVWADDFTVRDSVDRIATIVASSSEAARF